MQIQNWVKITQAIDIKKNNIDFESPEPDGSFILENKYFVTAVWSTCKVKFTIWNHTL